MKVLNQSNVKANDWYRHVPVKSKEELGIKKIVLHPHSENQVIAGLAGRLTVHTIGGLLFVAIWNSKEGDGTFYLTADNSEDIDGKYYNSFIPSDDFRAFILTFADNHTEPMETASSTDDNLIEGEI